MIITSSAFPEQRVPKVESRVHELFALHTQNHPIPNAQIRQCQFQDIQELRKLQREWFPLNYTDDFYNRIIQKTAFCFVAEISIKPKQNQDAMKVLVGAIVFQISNQNDELEQSWYDHLFSSHQRAIYIMTIGVIDEMRSTGLAKKLLNQIIICVRQRPRISIIFLHVVSYNKRAIKFYKNNGFSLLQYLSDHYHIMGREYDGLKLGLFVNEGRRKQKWVPWFRRVFLRKQTIDQWPV